MYVMVYLLYFVICICVCHMGVYMGIYVGMCKCAFMCEVQRLTSEVYLNHSLPCPSRQHLPDSPSSLIQLIQLANLPGHPLLYPPCAGLEAAGYDCPEFIWCQGFKPWSSCFLLVQHFNHYGITQAAYIHINMSLYLRSGLSDLRNPVSDMRT